MSELKLGITARDTVSDFVGVVISRHEYFNGCVRFGLQPKIDKDGKLPDSQVFEAQQLVLVAATKHNSDKKLGGPHIEPTRPTIPRR